MSETAIKSRKDITDRMVCQAVADYSKCRRLGNFEILAQQTGAPIKVCLAAVERALDNGLIECGVSIGTAWLTDKGMEVLKGSDTE